VTNPNTLPAPARSKNRDALNAEISKFTEKEIHRHLGQELNAAGVTLRPDLFDRPDVRGRPGQASRHRPGRAKRREPPHRLVGQPVTLIAHPEQDGGAARRSSASRRRGAGRVRISSDEIGALRRTSGVTRGVADAALHGRTITIPTAAATGRYFEPLPGASFVVNGARASRRCPSQRRAAK